MINILIVEDDEIKLQKIIEAITLIDDIDLSLVKSVKSVHSARECLRDHIYDLLILDIVLPNRTGEIAKNDAGLRLLEEVSTRGVYKMPTHIVGITGHYDLLEQIKNEFSERMLTVLYYSAESDEWSRHLQERTRHIIAAKQDQDNDDSSYKSCIAVICALRSPELDALLKIRWNWQQKYYPNDDTIYYRGEIISGGNKHIVWAAVAARMGMPATAVMAMKMICQFRPKYIAMTGITAGVPGRTNFGDVLAANPSFDWGSGKWIIEDSKISFQPAAYHLPLDALLRNKIKELEVRKDLLNAIYDDWDGDASPHRLTLRVGPMASGASVLADGSTAENIVVRQRDLIGIEMETYGLFVAAEEAPNPKPLAFALKSVVDFANAHKSDFSQKYAAYTSARVLQCFVENYLL